MAIKDEEKMALKMLGAHIRSVRIANGFTLKALGYEIDKEPQSISRVEMGKSNPSYLFLQQLSIGLKVNIKALLLD
jgi:transcriptional regulator with XRE-family HTH domain